MPIADYYRATTRYSQTSTPNGRGGSTLTWAADLTFDGLINQASSQDVQAAAALEIVADHKLFCPVDVELTKDHLVGQDGKIFRVVSEPKDTVDRGHHLRVMLRATTLDNG